ncbi:MAG TPA: peptidylprolyl isomerase [Ohtaekwangia sp.]|nr:peptidylprolyl isomerase [Ohtaekwangia sp.]
MIRRAILLLCCSAILLPAFAQSTKSKSKAPKPVTVFSVNGKPTTAAEFIYLYRKNHQNKQTDYTTEKIQEYLDLFINFKLKVEEARSRGMDTTAAFRKEFAQYKEELRKPYLPDASMADSLVSLTYERLKTEVKAAHILVTVKPDAEPQDTLKAFEKITAIRKRILAGEDFETVATDASEDPSAKTNKGLLGYFTALQMVYPFENAAYNTTPGEISQPLRTRFGYHVVKVLERRPARGEVEVSHIMIRTGQDADNEKARNTIFDIHDKLRGGVAWTDLCREFSEDPGTKENGGRLRPFGVGAMANVPEFEQTAFSLREPGEISDPFQTQYGWHIMRLERRIPLPSFEEIRASLKNRVTRDERTQVSKQALQARLRTKYDFRENLAVKNKLLATADSALTQGKWKAPGASKASKDILFSLGATQYPAGGFFSYVQENQQSSALPPGKYLDQLYNDYVGQCILEKQEASILRENPEYSFLLKEYYEGILLFEIMEDEVWNKASEDSVGQVRYYASHQRDYQAGERAKVTLFSSSNEEDLANLAPVVRSGDEQKISQFATARRIRTESGYYKKDDKAIFGKIPWVEGVHSGENNGMYYLAWLKNILAPGPMSFEEARAGVISDYQNEVEKNWIVLLKKKYPVKVNEKGKRYIFEQLRN